jgi:rhamnulokinase
MYHYFLAIDLGAESGRIILGSLNSGKLKLKEIHRFANGMLHIRNKYYWNIGGLYTEIIKGLEICVQHEKIQPEAIGIDTWGVDFGLLTKDGTILGLPYAYRDQRTNNAIEEFTSVMEKQEIYNLTGTLFASYNTLFQLFAAKKHHPELINGAADLLFIPDLLAYFLTGNKKTEFSFATTTQLFNPTKNNWEEKLFNSLGISIDIMQDIIEPGSVIGYIEDDLCKLTGINKIPVMAVATHDTNSAIIAIPAKGDNWAFISSGTWSLMGVESLSPVISKKSFQMNFANEGGGWHTFHILKNHMGLWLLQQCRKSWKDKNYSYDILMELANQAKEFTSFIDVDDLSFLNPPDMCEAIALYCSKTNQEVPANDGQITRIILESLAFKYRETTEQLGELTGKTIDEIYITGGGINNLLLSQFTANVTGRIVKTGLAEGAAAGNIMMQAVGLGYVKSLTEIRRIISNSCDMRVYHPMDILKWNKAFSLYKEVIQSKATF